MAFERIREYLTIKTIVVLALVCFAGQSFAVIDPANPPATMRGTVDRDSQTRTFYLEKQSVRGPDFEVILLGTDGVTQTTIDPGPVRTYRGWCEEEPDSYVEATLLSNGDLRYHVFKGAADDWSYDPPFETDEYAAAVNNFTEISGTPIQPSGTPLPGASYTIPAATLDEFYLDVYQADFGYDILVEYMDRFNYSDLSTYARKAENAISHYNAIYIRDILAECKLGKVVVRQSNAGLDRTSEQWGIDWWNINNYWNAMFPTVDHHFVGMVGSVGGGVAFGSDYGGEDWAARSYNGWSGNGNWWHVARHEHGHNWGCGDCVEGCPGPDGRTLNSGNNITLSRFSNPEIDQIMRTRRNKYGVLRYIGAYDYPVQPYANLDDGIAAHIDETLSLDVLGNDYDANADHIAISSFDATTTLGGTVAFSAGTGPDGRDELVYSAHPDMLGLDTFTYRITDSTGRIGQGNVRIIVDNILTVTPVDGIAYAGGAEGPFVLISDTETLTLSNISITSLDWTASKTATWFDLSLTSGTISPDNSVSVAVTINAAAESLPLGEYTDTITITDTTNDVVTLRNITLEVTPRGLMGYWKLDETTGTTAYDSAANANHGSLQGGNTFDASSVTGQFGGGLTLDGTDDYVEIPALNLNSNTVTMTTWVKWNGTQADWAGIVFSRAGSSVAGISMKTNGEIRYHWNNTASSYNWSSGLIVPTNQWVFVALVVEPTKATMYMYDGSIHSNSQTISHDIEEFDGVTRIGYDNGSRYFNGDSDDVRIYNVALTEAQILDVVAGGGAESPNPFDGAVNLTLETELSWAMGATAIGNDIYIGTDEAAVENADLDSPEYIGSQPENAYSQMFEPNTEYFWRIDQVDGSDNVITGRVWSFTTSNGTGAITRQVWEDISGAYVYDLTDNPAYPDSPTFIDELSLFEGPTNWSDNYGTKIHGFLIPKETGLYTFWIASDDRSELWLSSDMDPANIEKIAEVAGIMPTWTDPRQWDKYASQQSIAIRLFQGKPYYIMALHKEGGGGDNIAVAWEGPGIAQQVISGQYLMPHYDDFNWGPKFTDDPIVASDALEGILYDDTVAGQAEAFDGGSVSYSKASGPFWLSVAADGTLSGVPGDGDVGLNHFTVRATDDAGNFNEAALNITVLNTFTGELGLTDFAGLAARWLDTGCTDTPPCGGADLTEDGSVGIDDLRKFADLWLITP